MIDLNVAAAEVFTILRSYDYTVHLYDDEGNRVTEPEDARRMFAAPENLLVSLVDEGDNSAIRLYLGKRTRVSSVMGLVQTLRTCAAKHNLLFNLRRYGREIVPKDFATKAAVREAHQKNTDTPEMTDDLLEGMYGTSRSSYLKLEHARMIVRHSARIDAEKPGARGRQVESIFVENRKGERHRMPNGNLAAGRAMAQHVNQGGLFSDDTGKAISRMAEDYTRLSKASRHIRQHKDTIEESEKAMAVREMCRGKMVEMRRMFERMYRPSSYESAKGDMTSGMLLNEDGADGRVTPEMLEEMRTLLDAKGGEKLSMDVIECACRANHQKGEAALDEAGKKPVVEKVSVLGKPVPKDAWLAFKAGKIDLNGTPDLPSEHFGSPADELQVKLRAVAEVAADDGMSSLLSYVASEIEYGKAPPDRMHIYKVVAMSAIKAAGLGGNTPKVVKEFMEWLRRADPLLETPYPDDYGMWGYRPDEDTPSQKKASNAIEHAVNNFDVDDFLNSRGADDYLGWKDRADLDPDEKTVTTDDIAQAIEAYLDDQVQSDEFVTHLDLSDDAAGLVDTVRPKLEAEGYTVTEAAMAEGSMDEGEELTREDILLPDGDMAADLESEVTTGKKPEGPEMTDDAISRIRTLAGMR